MNINDWIGFLKTTTNIQVLIKDIGLTPQAQKTFWKNLLALLKEQASPISLLETDKGLFKFITDNADLSDTHLPPNDELISYLYENIKVLCGTKDSFWNESVQKLVEFFSEKFDFNNISTILPIAGDKDITIQTLKDANAGANFPEYDEVNYPGQYVIPWWNVAGESYEEERGHDQLTETIERDNKLQFTREVDKDNPICQWLRLLMPQYGRRVEIEDLDRNFWVISQTIAAISNYLFGDDCPIPATLEGLTREVSEIWENILYLWLGIAMRSQEQNKDIKTIVLPLPPRKNDHSRRFDMIDESEYYTYENTDDGLKITINNEINFLTDIKNRLSYLTELYDTNLCVIPFIRLDNYKHNHYAAEWYPYILTYYKNNKGWDALRLKERVDDKAYEFVISPKYEINNRFSPNIYASKQDPNGRLLYKYPFSELSMTNSDGRLMLYAALRTIPEVSVELTLTQVKVNSLKIRVYDASNDIVNGTSREIGVYNYTNEGLESYVNYTPTNSAAPQEDDFLHYKRFETNKPGYYLGEIPSWKGKTARIVEDEDIFNREAYVIKIGSYMPNSSNPADSAQLIANAETACMSDHNHTLMRGNITTTLPFIAPNLPNNGQTNCFWENPWGSYVPERDKVGEGNAGLTRKSCFDDDIFPVSTRYIDEKYLKTKGLIAVKNYLQKTNHLDSPCYVMTAIGLTPWQNENNLIYWDIGGLCHLYHYIPSANTLDKKPTDNSYKTAYDDIGILDTSQYYPEDYYPENSEYVSQLPPPSPLIYIEDDYDALCYYQNEIAACQEYVEDGVITGWESPAVYGNIDMDNRQILEEPGQDPETVLGAWSTFVYEGITRIIICFSMLQQTQPPATEPIKLTDQQCNDYLVSITDRVMAEMALSHEPTYDQYDEIKRRIFEYDAQDKKLIAGVEFTQEAQWDAGTKTAKLSEALHYVGKFGSIQMTAEELQELCDKYEIEFDDFVAINNPQDFAAISYGGKIVSCNTILRLDTFFEVYGMSTREVYYRLNEGFGWRQFQLVSNTDEKCDCIIVNEGDIEDDGKIYYDVQFATEFNGMVNYYDNRKAQAWGKETFDPDVQVGTAKVKIDNTGYSQSVEDVGHIATAREGDITLRENLAVSDINTGFAKSPVDFFNPAANMAGNTFNIFNGARPVSRQYWKF